MDLSKGANPLSALPLELRLRVRAMVSDRVAATPTALLIRENIEAYTDVRPSDTLPHTLWRTGLQPAFPGLWNLTTLWHPTAVVHSGWHGSSRRERRASVTFPTSDVLLSELPAGVEVESGYVLPADWLHGMR